MKRIFVLITIAAFLNFMNSCSGCKSTPQVQEAAIAFTVDANGTIQTPGTSYVVNTTLTSTMPGKGISIVATVTDQTNNNSITQNAAISSSISANAVTVINLLPQRMCTVTITISSIATPTNKSSQSFNLVDKQ